MKHYELAVIGSGPAGQKAAIQAAKLGKRCCIIEKNPVLGGAGINTGTIPSKALREAVLHLTGTNKRALYGENFRFKRDITIEGLDIDGNAISEVIALDGATAVNGTKAFAEVTLITLPHYAVADTERVRVGTGAKLGLPVRLGRNTVLAAFLDGAREAVAPTVAVDADDLESNTLTLNSALDGSEVIVDFYETE